MQNSDTITAIATPPGKGGVGIVRVSGPKAADVAKAITGKSLSPRLATFCDFRDTSGELIDQGLAILFIAPHSFTGETVLELQGHGGPVILDTLLKAVLNIADVRMARAGEFTERAFLNDKLDLAQAEAVADLIEASSEQAAKSALRTLQGAFSQEIQTLNKQLIALRMYVEAAIDFPEEEIDFLSDGKIQAQTEDLLLQLNRIKTAAKQGVLLTEGVNVVLAGKPNAGKSSLLNRLSGTDTAIVTEIAGTTRDVLREHIQLDGIPLHIIDTAGLHDSPDIVEQEGIRRAKAAIESADVIVIVMDSQQADEAFIQQCQRDAGNKPILVLMNKCDLTDNTVHVDSAKTPTRLFLSAKTGEGMDLFRAQLKTLLGAHSTPEGSFTARRRHIDALDATEAQILQGLAQLNEHRAGELLAEDLRQAQNTLNKITGEFHADDLLGEIFSSFCVGK